MVSDDLISGLLEEEGTCLGHEEGSREEKNSIYNINLQHKSLRF